MRIFEPALVSLLLCLTPLISHAQEVPSSARGIWNVSACEDPRAAVALGKDFAILFQTDPERGPVVGMGPVRWNGETAVLWQGGVPLVLPPPDSMTSCSSLPAPAYAAMGEAIALFTDMDAISDACGNGDGQACAERMFDFADVSTDDRLSLAEISRIVRGIGTFAVYEGMIRNSDAASGGSIMVPVSNLTGATMLTSFLGPLMTRNLLASYDFDGDNFLTLDEIVQDREPLLAASPSAAAAESLSAAFAQSIMADMVEMAAANMAGIITPMMGALIR